MEATLGNQWQFDDWRIPVRAVYSYTATEFQTSFDSGFPLWNDVKKGDELPYMPRHQLFVSVGLGKNNWDVDVSYQYVDEQLEQAGRAWREDGDGPLAGVTVDGYQVVDVVARYRPAEAHLFYFKVDNLLDEEYLVSRRPFGARPGKPAEMQAGYRYTF